MHKPSPGANGAALKRTGLLLGAVLLLSGCTGQQAVTKMSAQLSTSSVSAKTTVEGLKQSHQDEIAAHNETRATLKTVIAEYRKETQVAITASLLQEKIAALDAVDADYFAAVQEVETQRKTARALLRQKIEEKLKPLQLQAKALEKLAIAAQEKAAKYPADLDVASARQAADAKYLAAAAGYYDIRGQALEQGLTGLEDAAEQVWERLAEQRTQFRGNIETQYSEALEKLLAGFSEATVDLGPAPTLPTGYDVLIRYHENVKATADSILRQQTAFGFGAGSFLRVLLSSLGGGLVAGVTGQGGKVSSADVKTAGKAILDSVKDSFKKNLQNVEDNAQKAFRDIVSGLAGALAEKAANNVTADPNKANVTSPQPPTTTGKSE